MVFYRVGIYFQGHKEILGASSSIRYS
jgi:hypothetical protein